MTASHHINSLQPVLSEAEARRLTEKVKSDAVALWAKLLHLYEGNAHVTLGYSSWAAYCAAEFDYGRARSYQLLEAARVVERVQHVGLPAPQSDRVARELVPLLDEPEVMAEAWQDAVTPIRSPATTPPASSRGTTAPTAYGIRTYENSNAAR